MDQGYTIVNDNLYGGMKVVKQKKGFENLKNKIYVEICPCILQVKSGSYKS